MVKCNDACIPCCDFCIYAVHETFEDEELGGTIYGGPVHCEKHPDEAHDLICESCGSCDDFHCFRAETERTRASRRRSDWKHARRKKNKSSYYCKTHPWYNNLHQYSKNKIHCSCPMCSCKTNNKHKPLWGTPINWPMKDKKRIQEMKEQVEEEWSEDFPV